MLAMKRNVLSILVLLVLPNFLPAQLLAPYILTVQGGQGRSGDIVLEWTLGENFVETTKPGELIITQGFQQPASIMIMNRSDSSNGFDVYPNPVSAYLYIRALKEFDKPCMVKLLDSHGITLWQRQLLPGETTLEIDMSSLAQGAFLLNFLTPDLRCETFRVIKY
jgi:hypothetical protein